MRSPASARFTASTDTRVDSASGCDGQREHDGAAERQDGQFGRELWSGRSAIHHVLMRLSSAARIHVSGGLATLASRQVTR